MTLTILRNEKIYNIHSDKLKSIRLNKGPIDESLRVDYSIIASNQYEEEDIVSEEIVIFSSTNREETINMFQELQSKIIDTEIENVVLDLRGVQ